MANMSYCRFQNTLGDLNDCYNNIALVKNLDKYERSAREELIALCQEIAEWAADPQRDEDEEENDDEADA